MTIDGHLFHGKTVNTIIRGVKMRLSSHALKSLNNTEKIQLGMMAVPFNGNPSTTITYATVLLMLIINFYYEVSFLVPCIPKHNVLIIGGDINAQIRKNESNKFSWHKLSNRNEELPSNFSLENGLTCLSTKFWKKKGKLWINTDANNAKVKSTTSWIRNIFYSMQEYIFYLQKIYSICWVFILSVGIYSIPLKDWDNYYIDKIQCNIEKNLRTQTIN